MANSGQRSKVGLSEKPGKLVRNANRYDAIILSVDHPHGDLHPMKVLPDLTETHGSEQFTNEASTPANPPATEVMTLHVRRRPESLCEGSRHCCAPRPGCADPGHELGDAPPTER